MLFQQFCLESLGHASYLVGDEKTGQAPVFDPRRDVACYTEAARDHGLRISYALDSRGHNDYLSGLAVHVPGLEVLGSGYAGPGYSHRPVRDGEMIEIGEVGVRVFCATIQDKLLPLPGHIQVFPTHVAGSLCGGSIGSRLSTTVGYERHANAILAKVSAQEEFVTECIRLDDLPAVPPYWRRMRDQNLAGPSLLGVLAEPPALNPARFAEQRDAGNIVLDARSPEAFGGGHIPGALNVGLGPTFATWAGTVLGDGAAVLLVLDDPAGLWEATWQLLRVGYPPAGWLAGGMQAWRTAHLPLETTPQITADELKTQLAAGQTRLLDVRQPGEWAAGHVESAIYITEPSCPRGWLRCPMTGRSPSPAAAATGPRSRPACWPATAAPASPTWPAA